MAAPTSAGLLLYRRRSGGVEVLIGHMGGPFWMRKDDRAWSIPKGEYADGEDPFAAARREFREELGVEAPDGEFLELGTFRYSSGKTVLAFALESDLEISQVRSNAFELEWPPRSGRMRSFPEIDDARWIPVDDARSKLVAGQVPMLDALIAALAED